MLGLKEFAVPFGVLCLALWVWLFWARPTVLLSAFLATVVAMILLYRHEDVVQVVIEQKRVLVQMKDIRDQIFAKVEEVRRLAEKIGELTAFNIAQLWRLPPKQPEAVRLKERERLRQLLREMGIAESRVVEITSTITNMVAWDLARAATLAIPFEIFSGPAKGLEPADVEKNLHDVLLKSKVGDAQRAAQRYLEPLGAWTLLLQSKVAEFEQFRQTEKLPAVQESR